MKKGLYQEMSENKSIPQEKYLTQDISKNIYQTFSKGFPPTDSKEKLAQTK